MVSGRLRVAEGAECVAATAVSRPSVASRRIRLMALRRARPSRRADDDQPALTVNALAGRRKAAAYRDLTVRTGYVGLPSRRGWRVVPG